MVHFTKEYDCENHPPPSSFDGLSADHTGKISFHGPTSIFNFPFQRNRNEGDKILDAHDAQETRVEQWREHLVTNAWVQRAAEPLSTEAVRAVSFVAHVHTNLDISLSTSSCSAF